MEKSIVILTIRVSEELAEDVRRVAKKHDRSVNGEVVHVLRELVERESSDTMEQKKEPVAV